MQLDPGMAGQPGLDLGVLVGGVVVHHHMQLPTRIGAGDELEEVQELAVAMAGMAGVGRGLGTCGGLGNRSSDTTWAQSGIRTAR